MLRNSTLAFTHGFWHKRSTKLLSIGDDRLRAHGGSLLLGIEVQALAVRLSWKRVIHVGADGEAFVSKGASARNSG